VHPPAPGLSGRCTINHILEVLHEKKVLLQPHFYCGCNLLKLYHETHKRLFGEFVFVFMHKSAEQVKTRKYQSQIDHFLRVFDLFLF